MVLVKELSTSPAAAVADALRILHMNGCVPNYEYILSNTYGKIIKKGQVIFDIGAHAALHLKHFIDLTGETGFVVAFEPLPIMAQGLVEQFGALPNVDIRQIALSDHTGVAEFNFVENAAEMSGLREREYFIDEPRITKIEVKLEKLDNYTDKFERIDYIKIDVEGGEIDCIRGGADRFFKKHRPIISVEYGRPSYAGYGNTPYTLFDLASELNYTVADIFGNPIFDREIWGYICDRSAWDFFMIPNETLQAWTEVMLSEG
jgi:FkbM family methyltransferase